MKEPAFAYISREDFEAYRGDAVARSNYHVALTAKQNREGTLMRVAITEVPPTLIEKAWAAMTEDEQEVLAPAWRGGAMPGTDELKLLCDYMDRAAKGVTGAADKLRAAVHLAACEVTKPYE